MIPYILFGCPFAKLAIKKCNCRDKGVSYDDCREAEVCSSSIVKTSKHQATRR